jgi:hypothetical protein
VIGGSTNQPIVTYNFVASNGGVTITELGFGIGGSNAATETPITSVTVGGITTPVVTTSGVNGATTTGLNIVVPSGYAGVDVPVTVNYASVGLNGITSNKTATTTLTYVKYTSGGQTYTLTGLTAASNTMTVVGSKPTVSLAAPSGSLTTGTVPIASVTVTADAAGSIRLNNLPISVATSGTVSIAGGSSVLVYINGTQYTSVSGNTFTGSGNTVTSTITFTNGYTIPAGQSVTFTLYATIGGSLGSAGTSAVSVQITPQASFTWTDINGNVASITGTSIANFPTTTVSLHN